MKPWIQCKGATFLDLLDPTVEQVQAIGVEGFAYALAHLNRFTGWVGQYSVAQHSLNVAWCVSMELERPDLFLPALWHDGAEAATGDISTPMKRAILELTDGTAARAIREITDRMDITISQAFGVPLPTPEEHAIIKRADVMVLRAERERFMIGVPPEREADWEAFFGGLPAAFCADLYPSTPSEVAERFIMSHYKGEIVL